MPATALAPHRSHRKPKGEGYARRAEILAAAERIFVEEGYEGATIRKIADAVGLSSTALYMHFADKAEILHEICVDALRALEASYQSALHADQPAVVRTRRMIEAYVAFGFNHPNAYRLIYMTRPDEARHGAQSASQAIGTDLFRSFESMVGEMAADHGLATDPRTAAQVLWAAAHGVVSLLITKPYFDWTERDRLVAAALDAAFAGLRQR